MYTKDQVHVTTAEALAGLKVPECTLNLQESCKIVSSEGDLQVLMLKDFFANELIQELKQSSWELPM